MIKLQLHLCLLKPKKGRERHFELLTQGVIKVVMRSKVLQGARAKVARGKRGMRLESERSSVLVCAIRL